MKNNGNLRNLCDFIFDSVQSQNSVCIFFDQILIFCEFSQIRDADHHTLFSKAPGYFFQKLDIILFRKIQYNFGTSRIDQLFYIFHTFDISRCDNRDLRCLTDITDFSDRTVMLRICGRKVKYQKLICPIVTVKFCKCFYISVSEKISLSKSCYRFF